MAMSSSISSLTSIQNADPVYRENSIQAEVSLRITVNGWTASGRGWHPRRFLGARRPNLLIGFCVVGAKREVDLLPLSREIEPAHFYCAVSNVDAWETSAPKPYSSVQDSASRTLRNLRIMAAPASCIELSIRQGLRA